MSTLAVNTITNAAGGNTAQINGMTPTAQSLQGFRNRIINGNMVIDQRNNGASVSILNLATTFTLDRWRFYRDNSALTLTSQQSATAPTGFNNSLLVTVGTGSAPASTNELQLAQPIEGFNIADLGFGTASASAVTVSFWVRSSVTGTFAFALQSAAPRSYVATYTVNVANTFEYKTVTIPGDTSGTWLTNNGIGLTVVFDLGGGSNFQTTAGSWVTGNRYGTSGSVKLCATSGATFYITGVQLEAGSVATPFERRDYGRELMMCQRYLPAFNSSGISSSIGAGQAVSATSVLVLCSFPVQTRVAPTGISVSNISHITTRQPSGGNVASYTTVGIANGSVNSAEILLSGGSGGLSAGGSSMGLFNNASGQLLFTGCEL